MVDHGRGLEEPANVASLELMPLRGVKILVVEDHPDNRELTG